MTKSKKINEFIDYIIRFNDALTCVGYNGRFIPVDLEKKYGVIVGPSAARIINHLHCYEKIDEYEEIIVYDKNNKQKHKEKAFAIRFKN